MAENDTNRIINQPSDTELSPGDVVMVDSATEGTRQFDLGTALTDVKADIGDLSELETEDKSSLVGAINEARGSGGSGLTEDVKQALLDCFDHVSWDDDDPTGQTYIDALEQALYPPADLVSISAVYTQSGTVYDTDSLDSLKADLVVTATYADSTSETITDYTLSGTLAEGTSTITVSYGGKTTTFNVTVSEGLLTTSAYITISDETLTNGYINDSGEVAALENNYFIDKFYTALPFAFGDGSSLVAATQTKSRRIAEYDNNKAFLRRSYSASGNTTTPTSDAVYEKIGWANLDSTVQHILLFHDIDESLFVNSEVGIDANGDLSAESGMEATDLLPITNGFDKYVLYKTRLRNIIKIAFYDANQTFISRDYSTTASVATEIKYGSVPSNAVFYRVSKHAEDSTYSVLMKKQ